MTTIHGTEENKLTADEILAMAGVKSKPSATVVMTRLLAMSENSDAARAMTNAELAEAIRRTVGDNIPMHEPAYDLVEQASERLEALP